MATPQPKQMQAVGALRSVYGAAPTLRIAHAKCRGYALFELQPDTRKTYSCFGRTSCCIGIADYGLSHLDRALLSHRFAHRNELRGASLTGANCGFTRSGTEALSRTD